MHAIWVQLDSDTQLVSILNVYVSRPVISFFSATSFPSALASVLSNSRVHTALQSSHGRRVPVPLATSHVNCIILFFRV